MDGAASGNLLPLYIVCARIKHAWRVACDPLRVFPNTYAIWKGIFLHILDYFTPYMAHITTLVPTDSKIRTFWSSYNFEVWANSLGNPLNLSYSRFKSRLWEILGGYQNLLSGKTVNCKECLLCTEFTQTPTHILHNVKKLLSSSSEYGGGGVFTSSENKVISIYDEKGNSVKTSTKWLHSLLNFFPVKDPAAAVQEVPSNNNDDDSSYGMRWR